MELNITVAIAESEFVLKTSTNFHHFVLAQTQTTTARQKYATSAAPIWCETIATVCGLCAQPWPEMKSAANLPFVVLLRFSR